jgi:hypothetical protein
MNNVISEAIVKTRDIFGWMSEPELEWLAQKAVDCRVIIEVGAYMGKTSILFADLADKVYSIDAWEGNWFNGATMSWEYNPEEVNIYELFNKNLGSYIIGGVLIPLKMRSDSAVEWLKQNNIKADMIFIDGNHEHPVIDHDILEFQQFMNSDGIFCGHDANTNHIAVNEALNQHLPGWFVIPNTTIWQYNIKG